MFTILQTKPNVWCRVQSFENWFSLSCYLFCLFLWSVVVWCVVWCVLTEHWWWWCVVVSMYLYVCIGSLLAPNQYNTQCSRVAWTNNNIELLARKVENAIQWSPSLKCINCSIVVSDCYSPLKLWKGDCT